MKGWRTLFPNAWYVAVREYRSRARSRSFVLGTALLAIIAFAATQLPVLIDFAAATSQTRLEVVVLASGMPSDSLSVLDQGLNGPATSDPNAPKDFVLTWITGADVAPARLEGAHGGQVRRTAGHRPRSQYPRPDIPPPNGPGSGWAGGEGHLVGADQPRNRGQAGSGRHLHRRDPGAVRAAGGPGGLLLGDEQRRSRGFDGPALDRTHRAGLHGDHHIRHVGSDERGRGEGQSGHGTDAQRHDAAANARRQSHRQRSGGPDSVRDRPGCGRWRAACPGPDSQGRGGLERGHPVRWVGPECPGRLRHSFRPRLPACTRCSTRPSARLSAVRRTSKARRRR